MKFIRWLHILLSGVLTFFPKLSTQLCSYRLPKAVMLLVVTITSTHSMAQTSANIELIDVASFINGAYPYIPSVETRKKTYSEEHVGYQIDGISRQGKFSNDLFYISDGSNQKILYYALAAPATIDTFRISGDRGGSSMPSQFTFSVSQSPGQNFKTVAVFNTPGSYRVAEDRFYDFSIPAEQKITGRYVRVIVSGFKYNSFWNFDLSFYGQFNQPVQSQTDFSGIYDLGHWGSIVSLSDLEMVSKQKGTDYGSFLILHQTGLHINGCYVHGKIKTRGDDSNNFEVISEVIGNLTGSVENNVFRFTRTSAKYHDRRNGVMAFAPTGKEIETGANYGHFLVMRNPDSKHISIKKIMEGFQAFSASVSSRIAATTNAMCTIFGKVQFDNLYFDFDSDALTFESKATLDKVVEAAEAYPEWKFAISGYTDSIGSTGYNLTLSKLRAAAVVRYLVAQGVDVTRLQAKGYGATGLFGGNDQNSINRRVEVTQQ